MLASTKIEQLAGVQNIYEEDNIDLTRYMENAIKAQIIFKRDKDYIVKDGEVIIVDEFTGRQMPGRRYSEGLHQAIEAKEGVAKSSAKTILWQRSPSRTSSASTKNWQV